MKDNAFYSATSATSEIAAENRKIAYESDGKNQFILLHNLSLSEPAQNATLQGGTFYASSDRSRHCLWAKAWVSEWRGLKPHSLGDPRRFKFK
jgi:hypothetical protein